MCDCEPTHPYFSRPRSLSLRAQQMSPTPMMGFTGDLPVVRGVQLVVRIALSRYVRDARVRYRTVGVDVARLERGPGLEQLVSGSRKYDNQGRHCHGGGPRLRICCAEHHASLARGCRSLGSDRKSCSGCLLPSVPRCPRSWTSIARAPYTTPVHHDVIQL